MLEKSDIIRFGLGALYHTRAHLALERASCGIGLIFTLHRVYRGQAPEAGFAPNRILAISDGFLDQTIVRVRERGLEIVSLDEARKRIVEGDDRRFAVFTIDDGYRDSHDIAWPVFRRHQCPFTVYVASGLIDRTVNLWWVALEHVIAGSRHIEVSLDEGVEDFFCRTDEDKRATFQAIYWRLREMGEAQKLGTVSGLARRYNVDIAAIADELAMSGDELKDLASDPLVTIGAHTVDHPALARIDEREMKREISEGRRRLGELVGYEPAHLAYPYGDAGSAARREFAAAAELGFKTAVTTRKGVIERQHADHLTALPRISLNGDYQDLRYVDVLMSGAPFALINRFRRLNVN